jgi:hypothetical protein
MFPSFLDLSRSWGASTDEYDSTRISKHAPKTDSVNKRCIQEYNWTPDYTKRVLRGYQQFLELKASMEDLDGDTIIPSPAVNKYWRQHILHTKAYREDCLKSLGKILEYDPDTVDRRSSLYNRRLRSTQLALAARFGKTELDADVWDFRHHTEPAIEQSLSPSMATSIMPNMSMRSTHRGSPSSRASQRESREPSHFPSDASAVPVTPGGQNHPGAMTIAVRDQKGDEAAFKVKPTTKMEKLMKAYAKLKMLNIETLKFSTRNGREVYRNDTSENIGLKDGEVLFVAY